MIVITILKTTLLILAILLLIKLYKAASILLRIFNQVSKNDIYNASRFFEEQANQNK